MERYSKLPFYAKATYLIVGLTAFFLYCTLYEIL
jgi:hypothetical protein